MFVVLLAVVIMTGPTPSYPYVASRTPSPDDSAVAGASASSRAGIAGLTAPEALTRWAADGWRQQRTPGAYEWWHFDAIDAAGNGVVIALYDGFCFHSKYLSEIRRFHWRMHKRDLSGIRGQVLPTFYPAAYVAVFQGGRCAARFFNMYPPGSFKGCTDWPEFQVGPNRVTLRQDGSFGISVRGYPSHITPAGPRHRRDQSLIADLTFVPSFPTVQHSGAFRPDGADGAHHEWIVAAPHGTVTGRVQHLDMRENLMLLDFPVNTLGFHDHHVGGSGIGRGMKRFTRGRALGDDWAVVWNVASGLEAGAAACDKILIFQKGAEPIILDHPRTEIRQTRLTKSLVRYPCQMTMHGSDTRGNTVELLLSHRHVMETTPFSVRTSCAMQMRLPGKRQFVGRGMMETNAVHNLTLPIISDVAIRSIIPIEPDDPLWRQ